MCDNKFEDKDVVCRHVFKRKKDIIRDIEELNIKSIEQLQDETNVATMCSSCYCDVEAILEEELDKKKHT